MAASSIYIVPAFGSEAVAPAVIDSTFATSTDAEPAVNSEEGHRHLKWSLPIAGKLVTVATNTVATTINKVTGKKKETGKRLDGGITLGDTDNLIGERVEELLDKALDRNARSEELNKAVAHYRTRTQRAIAQTKDATDYVIPYRGFGPSIEAANVILDEKVSVKSRASAEYARQKLVDETHFKVVSAMMQMSMGLGMTDQIRGQGVAETGLNALIELVGEEEAMNTRSMLLTWAKQIEVPSVVYERGPWDIVQKQDKLKSVMETAMNDDPIVHEITKRLHKYNKRSKFARVGSSVVQTTLGVASLTPSFAGPAAKVALLTFVMATGGPESCKLMKELYLDKRFESRWKTLNEETHMALENYEVAALTKNPLLLACSESLISKMTTADHAKEVLGLTVFKPGFDPNSGPEPDESAAPAPESSVATSPNSKSM